MFMTYSIVFTLLEETTKFFKVQSLWLECQFLNHSILNTAMPYGIECVKNHVQ